MEAFVMEIAGLPVCVKPMFGSTREYCRPYLTEKQPEIVVTVTLQDLAYEQEMAEKEAVEEGLRIRKFTDPFLERATIQRAVARELVNRDTLLFHGSTVAVDGEAYIFTAACRVGKSTHTGYWRELFGTRAVMVNDDKPFLKLTADGVLAYGSPWTGKHGLGNNVCFPLKGICFLHRGQENTIRRLSPADCMDELLHQSFLPAEEREKAVSLVEALASRIPLWELACIKDSSAAQLAYNTMSQV